MVESSSFSLEAPPASRRITLCTVSRSPVTSRLNLSELSSDLRNQSMRCTAAPTRGANPGRAGARAGQPRPLPAARRRLGGPVHQPERHNLGHAGRRRGRSCRHRIRQPGRAAVDDPGAAGPLASAVGPGGTSGTPRFPAAVLRHPTETATQRGPFRAKDTASQSIWITAGTVEGEYCSEDVGFWSTWLCRADTQIEHSQIVGIDAYAVGWCAPMKRPQNSGTGRITRPNLVNGPPHDGGSNSRRVRASVRLFEEVAAWMHG